MIISRETVLRTIARMEPVSSYPFIETGQYGTLLELQADGLITITGQDKDLGELRLTEKGREQLAKL